MYCCFLNGDIHAPVQHVLTILFPTLRSPDRIDSADNGDSSPAAAAALAKLLGADAVHTGFNTAFLIEADATDPTVVGIWGALKGSLLTMFVTLLLAFPVGVSLGRAPCRERVCQFG